MRRAPNFGRLAGLYRWMELVTFGPWLWRCRTAFLDKLTTRRNALILGDGDGRFTARLLELNPYVVIDALDVSPEMLRRLIHNAGSRCARVRAIPADARLWEPDGARYDLIVTHFFLDCLTTGEVSALAARLRPSIKPDGMWVISQFAVPRSMFGWLVAWPIVTFLYLAFGVLAGLAVSRLPDHRKALAEAGFVPAESRPWLRGLLVSEVWQPRPDVARLKPVQPKS